MEIGKIDKYLHKAAWTAWKQLPVHTKFWITDDDLYQDARCEAVRIYPKWDKARGTYFTFAFPVIHNQLRNIILYWTARKRRQGLQTEVKTLDWEIRIRRTRFDPVLEDPILKMLAGAV